MENFVADAIFIDAPPERVFAALLDPDEVCAWMEARSAAIEARPGGGFCVERTDGSRVQGTIALHGPPRELEIGDCREREAGVGDGDRDGAGDGAGERGPMLLRFLLEPHDGGVWLTVRQEGLDCGPRWQAFAQSVRKGWVRATVALKRHIEQI